MTIEDIKDKLPPTFVNKPNTVILIDADGNPWYHLNEDGTSSGFDVSFIKPHSRNYLWHKKRKK